MTDMPIETPIHQRTTLADKSRIFPIVRAAITWLFPGTAPKLSDHIARDIGLSRHQLDLMRHQWPSQDPKNPRL